MNSHVLLAACDEAQFAQETVFNGVPRGRFSEGLIHQFNSVSLETTTYRDIIRFTGSWNNQNPQIEGAHKDRLLFSATRPPSSTELPVLAGLKAGLFQINLGSAGGVVAGTEFMVTDREAGDSPVGFLMALQVTFHSSVLVEVEGRKNGLTVPSRGWKARVSDWNHQMLKIFLAPDFDTTVGSVIFPHQRSPVCELSVSQLESKPGPNTFFNVDRKEDADIQLSVRKEGDRLNFAIETLQGIVAHQKLHASHFSLEVTHLSRLRIIMDAAARFHYFLNKHPDRSPRPALNITLDMHTLQDQPALKFIAGRRVRVRDPSPNILDAQLRAEVATTDKIGFTFFNHSPYNIFPYLFYFDPTTYSIFVSRTVSWRVLADSENRNAMGRSLQR